MARDPIHELPAQYREIRHVVLTNDKLLVMLNLLALVPLVLMLAWMAIWWGIISVGRTPTAGIDLPWWLAIIAILLIVLPLHEIIHGLAFTAVGHKATYGMKLSKGILYAMAEHAIFRRNEYLVVALAPVVVITLVAMVLMALVPQGLAYYIALAAVLNAGGAIGDLWMAWTLLRYPASILISDEADGFRIYADGSYTGSSVGENTPPSVG